MRVTRPPRAAVAAVLLAALLGVVAGCEEEPVLVAAETSPEVTPLPPVGEDEVPSPWGRPAAEPGAAYQRPDGVFVDVRWLGGRSLSASTAEVADQLGTRLGELDLGTARGREITYERGAIRVVRDVIYMVRVDLPRPMTRSEALELAGFPPFADSWRATHREYRLGHSWDFERFRLARASGAPDRVVSVEAWKVSPERAGR